MSKVLILYPSMFKCYSKFFRKVGKIISSLSDVTLLYQDDPNGFVQKLCDDSLANILSSNVGGAVDIATHAIIFDDGEEFPEEIGILKLSGKPVRVIKVPITRVINIKTESEYKSEKSTPKYEYIGRGSYWGNPYSMSEEGDDREEVIRKYKYDFDFEKFPNKDKAEVYKLAGKRLGCFCKPQACHGDVLEEFLNSWDNGK